MVHKCRMVTTAEKAQCELKRSTYHAGLKNALNAAFLVIMEQAKQLHDEFPGYTKKYYFQLLMQHACKKGSSHKVSLWNAFLFDYKCKGTSKCSNSSVLIKKTINLNLLIHC